MTNRSNMIPIAGRLHCVAEGEPVCGADEVLYEPEGGTPVSQDDLNERFVDTSDKMDFIQENEYNKPASTGTTGNYPYNGMGRVVIKKNMVGGVNTLTEDAFYIDGAISGTPLTNTIFVIKYDFVLGEDITIPSGCVLEFEGGSISGIYTITGQNTAINAEKITIFKSGITIAGTWNVPYITSNWFECINDNDLIQVFNLLSDSIQNVIVVEKRSSDYWVDCQVGGTLSNPVGILNLKSNTKCIINGTVRQRGHATDCIHLVNLYNVKNVEVVGSGELHGDKELHDYTEVVPITIMTNKGDHVNTHEHNHIINVQKCVDVTIDGLTLKDATGDGIDILNLEENIDNNIAVRNFYIDNCRRQGISAEGNNILIENGIIKNVGTLTGTCANGSGDGTLPMSAIDIEISFYSQTRTAKNIICRNLDISDCYRAFLATTDYTNPADMGEYRFEKCIAKNLNMSCYFDNHIKDVVVKDCDFSMIPLALTSDPAYNETFNKTLTWSLGDNILFDNCVFTETKDKEGNYNGMVNYHTMINTFRTSNPANRENRTTFRNCIVNAPHINALLRSNYNTTIDNCTIKAGWFVSENYAKNSRIINSVIELQSTFTRSDGVSGIYLDGWKVAGCQISIKTPFYLKETDLFNNIVRVSGDDAHSATIPSGISRAYFCKVSNVLDGDPDHEPEPDRSGDKPSTITNNQIIVGGSDANILYFYIDTNTVESVYVRFMNNIINNLGDAFAELPVCNKPSVAFYHNNVVGYRILPERIYTTTEIVTSFPADALAVDYNTKKWTDVQNWYGHLIDVTEHRGDTCKFTGGVSYTVIKSMGNAGDAIDYATGYGTNPYDNVADFVVPSDASYIWVSVNGGDTSGNRKPTQVEFMRIVRH